MLIMHLNPGIITDPHIVDDCEYAYTVGWTDPRYPMPANPVKFVRQQPVAIHSGDGIATSYFEGFWIEHAITGETIDFVGTMS